MLTRCPRCDTTFRVTPEQLKARQGRVRCGECQEVFNAIDMLIEAAPVAVAPQMAAAPSPAEVAVEKVAGDVGSTLADDRETETETETETAAEAEAEAEAAIAGETPEVGGPAPDATAEAAAEPLFEAPARRRRWPWALGGIAALLVLLAQATMHFRTEIAVLYPSTGPALAAACEVFACKLLLPRKAELMSIEASDLHPETGGKLVLTATLKNRAPFAQEYPHLELTLTDTADKPLLRRVLAPVEYLGRPPAAEGFAAGKELPVDLAVEAPGVPAAGYRLYLFYP